jgi:hypothetical protein
MTGPLQKAVEAGCSANIIVRTVRPRRSIRFRYAGPVSAFVIEELQIGRESVFAAPGSVAAETLEIDWLELVPAGTEIYCRVRNISSAPATFVAIVAD